MLLEVRDDLPRNVDPSEDLDSWASTPLSQEVCILMNIARQHLTLESRITIEHPT